MRTHARAAPGERAYDFKPFYRGGKVSVIGAIAVSKVLGVMTIDGSMDSAAFEVYISKCLVPQLWEGAVVVMDNLPAHKVKEIAPLIEAVGAKILFYGGEGDDLLAGQNGTDWLYGEEGNDYLKGEQSWDWLYGNEGNDTLSGGHGNDRIKGGEGNDVFVFDHYTVFDAQQMGIDLIYDFGDGEDLIRLDKTAFTALESAAGNGFSRSGEFAVVNDDSLVATSTAYILYSSSTGNLFYNENGSAAGLGDGGQFASLQSAPSLDATSFTIAD